MNPIVCCQDLQVREEVHKLGVLILLWRRQLAQSYISDLESGAVDPRWSTIYRVIYGLGEMNIQDFLNGPQTIRSLKIH